MKEYGMRVVYFDTLYNRESSYRVFGDIEFKEGCIWFASCGHKFRIELDKVIRIENLEEA